MVFSISGKVFVLTGASTGIGKALALRLAEKGGKLVLANRNANDGEALVADLKAKFPSRVSDFVFVQTDVAKKEDVERLFDTAVATFGGFDGLINNAGVSGQYISDILNGEDTWESILAVNLGGVLRASRIAMTHFVKSKKSGVIVNTGSLSSFMGHTDPVYGLTKLSLNYLSSTLNFLQQMRPYRRLLPIRMNTLAVVFVETDIWAKSGVTMETLKDVPIMGKAGQDYAGGWTPMEKVIGQFVRAIEDETLNGQTILVSGKLPVQNFTPLNEYEFRQPIQFPEPVIGPFRAKA